jgi:hypothetical protein
MPWKPISLFTLRKSSYILVNFNFRYIRLSSFQLNKINISNKEIEKMLENLRNKYIF